LDFAEHRNTQEGFFYSIGMLRISDDVMLHVYVEIAFLDTIQEG